MTTNNGMQHIVSTLHKICPTQGQTAWHSSLFAAVYLFFVSTLPEFASIKGGAQRIRQTEYRMQLIKIFIYKQVIFRNVNTNYVATSLVPLFDLRPIRCSQSSMAILLNQ
jgi:hypothetical protein